VLELSLALATPDRPHTIRVCVANQPGLSGSVAADLTNYPINFTALGLPTVNNSLSANCAGLLGIPGCNDTDFYHDFGNHDPVYAPFTTPVYSNVVFDILGMVIEAVSNTISEDYFQKEILNPLGLKNTA
jgi:hypothetical protein